MLTITVANIKFFACDITNPNAVYSTAKQIKETLGAPTILINNAGILEPHTILNTPDDYLRKIFEVNVLSNWYTAKAFLPDMVRQNKGHIVTVASLASFVGLAGMGDYTATKAAILSFHECPSSVPAWWNLLTCEQRSTKSLGCSTTAQMCLLHPSIRTGYAPRSSPRSKTHSRRAARRCLTPRSWPTPLLRVS